MTRRRLAARVLRHHPDRGGTHDQAVAAILDYRRRHGSAMPTVQTMLDRSVLDVITQQSGIGVPQIAAMLSVERLTDVYRVTSRLERRGLVHSVKVESRSGGRVEWRSGPTPKRLVA